MEKSYSQRGDVQGFGSVKGKEGESTTRSESLTWTCLTNLQTLHASIERHHT